MVSRVGQKPRAALHDDHITGMRRARGTRTPNRWFWRPVLYQLSYCPSPRTLGVLDGRHASAWPAKPSEGRSYGTDTSQREPARNTPATPWADPVETGDPAYGLGRPRRVRQWQDRDVTNPRTPLASLSDDDLAGFLAEQRSEYASLKSRGLGLDLTRGKPSAAQLDLANDLLHLPTSTKDRNGRRRAQLRRPRRAGGAARDLRRAALGRAGPGGRRRQLEPDDDVQHHRRLPPLRRGRLPAALEPGGEGPFHLPGPRLRPPLLDAGSFGIEMVTVDMHQDGPDMAAVESLVRTTRASRASGSSPPMPTPPRRRVAGGRRAPGRHADRGPRLHDLLGQRLRLPPPHRGRGEERRHPQPLRRLRPPQPTDHVCVDLQDHLRRRGRGRPRGQRGQREVVPRAPRDGLHRT